MAIPSEAVRALAPSPSFWPCSPEIEPLLYCGWTTCVARLVLHSYCLMIDDWYIIDTQTHAHCVALQHTHAQHTHTHTHTRTHTHTHTHMCPVFFVCAKFRAPTYMCSLYDFLQASCEHLTCQIPWLYSVFRVDLCSETLWPVQGRKMWCDNSSIVPPSPSKPAMCSRLRILSTAS